MPFLLGPRRPPPPDNGDNVRRCWEELPVLRFKVLEDGRFLTCSIENLESRINIMARASRSFGSVAQTLAAVDINAQKGFQSVFLSMESCPFLFVSVQKTPARSCRTRQRPPARTCLSLPVLVLTLRGFSAYCSALQSIQGRPEKVLRRSVPRSCLLRSQRP